jgi:hypothetical protein
MNKIRGTVSFLSYTFRQFKIKIYRALCLPKKLTSVTVYICIYFLCIMCCSILCTDCMSVAIRSLFEQTESDLFKDIYFPSSGVAGSRYLYGVLLFRWSGGYP